MSGVQVLLAAILIAILTGCGSTDERSSAEPSADPCEQVHDGANALADSLTDLSDEMKMLRETGQLDPVEMEIEGEMSQWVPEDLTQPGPGTNRYATLQQEAVETVRLWARIIVNNEDCFPPVDVAKAQELLGTD